MTESKDSVGGMMEQNRKRLEDLTMLQEVDKAFYATPILEFILGKIVRVISKTFKCQLCDFLLLDSTSLKLRAHPASSHGDSASSSPPPIAEDPILLSDPKNTIAQVFAEKKSRIIENLQEGFSLSRLGLKQSILSMLLVPLKIEQEVIGILRFGSSELGYFNDDHVRLAELVADRSAMIVYNARLYEKVAAANLELERLNKIKTEFVSMISHELRTPITAIKGFVNIVLTEGAGPINDQQKKFLTIAENSIDRLSLIISDLLDISKIEEGQMKIKLEPISVDKIMQDCRETHRTGMEAKRISLELHFDNKIPMVIADELRVKQVIDNLMSNAIKFTPKNGKIKINAEDMGDFVLFSIIDSGIGINKDEHDNIFNMFYQTDSSITRKVGGSGLGLSISKSIIEIHGGKIWVESESGQGSIFRFLLPRHRNKKLYNVSHETK